MNEYCQISDVENYLLITIEDYFKPEVLKFIKSSSKEIDRATNRTFDVQGTEEQPVEKKYDGHGRRELVIDDLLALDSVTVDGVEKEPLVLLYPANSLPKTSLYLEGDIFARGRQNVSVKGVWGYAEEVPDDIKFVCTVLTASKILASYEGGDEIKSEKIGEYQVTYKDDKREDITRIKEILDTYKRYAI